MGIILDTGFLYSLKIKQDELHSISKKILKELDWKKYGLIVTSNLVINELYTLVNIRTKSNKAALKQIEQLIWGAENFFRIIFLNHSEFQETAHLLRKYSTPDRILSFVDASLIYLSQKFNFTTIISFDNHFDGILTRISE
ncbi:MAG: type II toxin-antitoxin system VapC family toxin [Candidatus Helarchaeota archaeon]